MLFLLIFALLCGCETEMEASMQRDQATLDADAGAYIGDDMRTVSPDDVAVQKDAAADVLNPPNDMGIADMAGEAEWSTRYDATPPVQQQYRVSLDRAGARRALDGSGMATTAASAKRNGGRAVVIALTSPNTLGIRLRTSCNALRPKRSPFSVLISKSQRVCRTLTPRRS